MSIVRSESLLDAILTSNTVAVSDANQSSRSCGISTNKRIPPTNSEQILSPAPTEESLALTNRKNQVDVSSFDALANRKETQKLLVCNTNVTVTRLQKSKRDKIKSFIEFDDEDENENDNKSNHDRFGRWGQRSLSNGKSLDYSYCDNVELADVFSVTNSSKNNRIVHHSKTVNQKQILPTLNNNNNDDVEWAQFQSSQIINKSESDILSEDIDTENNNNDKIFHNDDDNDDDNDDRDDNDNDDDVDVDDDDDDDENENVYSKLEKLEAEQEILNNSLLALTSHFAKVQFRIKQIVNNSKDVKQEQRETLLKDLEAFANRGIPELMSTSILNHSNSGCASIATTTGRLERTTSMATSLMADDVFDDDLDTEIDEINDSLVTEAKLEKQRTKQKELIERLKDQLEDLERYAFETGDISDLPSSMLLERQNVIIEQLKSKLPILTIDEIDKLSPDQLRARVDKAVRDLVSPVLMKEQLVSQLKTQVTDLERFIEFLQKAQGRKIKNEALNSGLRQKMSQFLKLKHQKTDIKQQRKNEHNSLPFAIHEKATQKKQATPISANNSKATTPHTSHVNIIRRIVSLLQVFAWTQIGFCTSIPKYSRSSNTISRNYRTPFERNTLKRQTRHFGDLRAHLEMSIDRLLVFYNEKTSENDTASGNGSSTNEDFISLGETKFVINNYFLYEQMNIMVRKDFAIALKNLIQHGLKGAVCDEDCDQTISRYRQTSSIMSSESGVMQSASTNASLLALGLGCFGLSSRAPHTMNLAPIGGSRPSHAWEVILFYYNLKNGSILRSDSSRRLSQSFGLQVVTGMNTANPKYSLLTAIDDIIDSHTRLKRSLDAHFKAFVCVALNQKMLSQWLRLIVRNTKIINDCYERWSYASSTGFEDALRQMDKLASLKFCLPIDIAVRQLQSIHDVF